MKDGKFLNHLLRGVISDMHQFQPNNIDYWRYPAPRNERAIRRLRDSITNFVAKRGFVRRGFSVDEVADNLQMVLNQSEELETVYNSLQDDASRDVLVDLLKFRILGHRHSKLGLNDQRFWKARSEIKRKSAQDPSNPTDGSWEMSRFKLEPPYDGVELEAHPLGLLNVFVLEQYAYRKASIPIEVKPGDVVIDGGGCFGDTAIYFAHKAGPDGRVFSFEFVPENLAVFNRNLALNTSLAKKITVLENPLWRTSGDKLRFSANGPSTRIATGSDPNSFLAETLSIDDLVQRESLPFVSFIKMDIEGAELAALHGAEATLRAFRPRLAISVYHHKDDLLLISGYLEKLELGYKFFLDQFTIYGEETVLFARCE